MKPDKSKGENRIPMRLGTGEVEVLAVKYSTGEVVNVKVRLQKGSLKLRELVHVYLRQKLTCESLYPSRSYWNVNGRIR